MRSQDGASVPPPESTFRELASGSAWSLLLSAVLLLVVGVMPALAQSSASEFCKTDMAQTIKNIFLLIQFGGPLVGGVIFLGATVLLPMYPSSDAKRRLKQARIQGLLWGVLVAPLGTGIIQFLLNYVVVGGASCSF